MQIGVQLHTPPGYKMEGNKKNQAGAGLWTVLSSRVESERLAQTTYY